VRASVSLGRGDCDDESVGKLEEDAVGGDDNDASVVADIVDVASEETDHSDDCE
jgi:hypothetical protein